MNVQYVYPELVYIQYDLPAGHGLGTFICCYSLSLWLSECTQTMTLPIHSRHTYV